MKLTRKCEYGLRGLLYLAHRRHQEKILTAEVSAAENIPPSFLNKIFQRLAKAGVLRSARGCGGGFYLAQEPGEITLRKIIEALDGPIRLSPENSQKPGVEMSGDGNSLALTTVWQRIQSHLNAMLEKTTILDLIRDKMNANNENGKNHTENN